MGVAMKKGKWAIAAGLLLVTLVGVYAGAAWYVGGRVQAGLGAGYQELKRYGPYVAVAKRVYRRHVFSARERVRVSVFAPDPRHPLRPERRLVSFNIVSRIHHLPLSGLFALRAASVQSTVNFVPGSMPDEEEWTGGENLARVHTDIALGGEVRTTLTIPAFAAPRLSSQPATLTFDFPDGLKRYSLKGSAPRFAVTGDQGERLQITGAHIEGTHERMLPDVPDIYAGSDRLTLASIALGGRGGQPVAAIRQAAIEMRATSRNGGKFMDTAIRYSLKSATVLGNSFGPAALEVAVRHLHTRSFATLSRINGRAGGNAKRREQAADDVLLNNPEISAKLNFTVPDGDTVVTAQARLHNVTSADLKGGSATLRNKVEVTVDARTPVSLLLDKRGRTLPVYQPLAQALPLPRVAGGLRGLIAAGYITRDGNELQTRFVFRNGRYSLNGKEYTVPKSRRARR